MTGLEAVPRHAPVVAVALDGQTVVYAHSTGGLHRLDESATLVWQLLDGRTPLSVTVDDLAEAFGTTRSVVAADVLRLVDELVAQELVVLD